MSRTRRKNKRSLVGKSAEDIFLSEPMTQGYRVRLPVMSFNDGSASTPWLPRMLQDVERMIATPYVSLPLQTYRAGIASVRFKVKASSQDVATYVQGELTRFWQRALSKCQRSYEYGWIGCEVNYVKRDGRWRFDELLDFHPRDVKVLVRDHKYVGMRVSHVDGALAPVDLWGPLEPQEEWYSQEDREAIDLGHGAPVLAKGFWYGFRKRFNRYYGFPILYPAWRPWRRLAGRDGAEEMTDTAFYRLAGGAIIVRYPAKTIRNKDGTVSPQGSASRTRSRDVGKLQGEHGTCAAEHARRAEGIRVGCQTA